ncbi:hypothetical protein VT03_06995 [Planctomyces sp. SH-PL14]|nr:hypothetical protein VT03_06995 [Planctomyces sp. SH-PL14]
MGSLAWMATVTVPFLASRPAPEYVRSTIENPLPLQFVGPRALLLSEYTQADYGHPMPNGPLYLLDVPTGRMVELGNGDQQTGQEAPAKGQFGGFLQDLAVAGDFIVANMSHGEHERRLRIWNWKTGQLRVDRDSTSCKCGVIGDLAWLQLGPTFELLRMSDGASVPWNGPADRIDFSTAIPSRDGRFVIKTDAIGVHVWRLDSAAEHLKIEGAQLAACSSDSRWLATLSRIPAKDGQSGRSHVWQVYDLQSGQRDSERKTSDDEFSFDALAFHDEDRCLVAYSVVADTSGGTYSISQFHEIDVWKWRENTLERRRASPRHFQDLRETAWERKLTTPRTVIDRDHVLDVVTGKQVATLDESGEPTLLATAERWALVSGPAGEGHYSPISTRFEAPELLDVATGRRNSGVTDFWAGKFSEDGNWLVVSDKKALSAWSLPLRRRGRLSLGWALLAFGPLLAAFGFQAVFKGRTSAPVPVGPKRISEE